MIEWAADKAREKNQRMIGDILSVLIDSKDPNGEGYWGRYEGQAPDVDGRVFVRGGKLRVGQFTRVRITEADEENLFGHVNVEVMAPAQ